MSKKTLKIIKKEILLFTGLILLSSPLSFAQSKSACETPRNAFDGVYCVSTEFTQLDRDLNSQYGMLVKKLSKEQRQVIKKNQLKWMSARDSQCSDTKDNKFFINLQCANDLMRERIDFLKTRERECDSTGCVTDNLRN